MPKHLKNWTFEDVKEFLEQHDFAVRNVEGSHHYFVGVVDGEEKICVVQRHGNKNVIPPKTLKINIIGKSGIPLDYWDKWSGAGGARKKIKYEGVSKKTFVESVTTKEKQFIQIAGDKVEM